MKRFICLCLILTIGLLLSCDKKEIEDNLCDEEIEIDSNLFHSATSDNFTINNVSVVNNEIHLNVEYIAGCGDHDFQLITHGQFAESFPVQLGVILVLKSSDSCDIAVIEDLCFDLTELSAHYEQNYQVNEGTIIIWLGEYEQMISYSF